MQNHSNTEAQFRQRMMKYGETHSATEAANRYHVSRKTYYKWRKRWDGSWQSLRDQSRRPHHFPRKTSEKVLSIVRRRAKQCRWTDLLLAYQYARERDGYTGSYGAFKHLVVILREAKPVSKKKHKPKPYQRAEYPGQKVQVDVKFVPSECVTDGKKYYQYTAEDECSRWTFRELYDEHSTYSSKDFLEKLIRQAPLPIRLVQTDNGTEFTNTLLVTKSKHKTLFEQALLDMGIEYQRIRIATPRHNGKVERQHRTDAERFYSRLRMFSLTDGRNQLARYQKASNDHIKTCLNMKTPNQVVALYLAVL